MMTTTQVDHPIKKDLIHLSAGLNKGDKVTFVHWDGPNNTITWQLRFDKWDSSNNMTFI